MYSKGTFPLMSNPHWKQRLKPQQEQQWIQQWCQTLASAEVCKSVKCKVNAFRKITMPECTHNQMVTNTPHMCCTHTPSAHKDTTHVFHTYTICSQTHHTCVTQTHHTYAARIHHQLFELMVYVCYTWVWCVCLNNCSDQLIFNWHFAHFFRKNLQSILKWIRQVMIKIQKTLSEELDM